MKRGLNVNSLQELLKAKCKDGFYPWKVEVNGLVVYTYARTKVDAIKKIMNSVAKASPCSIEEILEASKSP